MKKLLCILLAFVMLASLVACGQGQATVKQDDSPVTMFVSLGNGESYYVALAELIESELGIDVELVYQVNWNTSATVQLYFAHNDLPADIVFTSSKTDDALLKDSCLDLLSRSSVTSEFTSTTIKNCTTEDGAIYQLPVSSKLIGITYNETLLKEMGWEVPESFADMVDLKAKCDEAGIKFAVFDAIATGHGFNWLFHLMGAQWLSTLEGTQWLENFQNGTETIEPFQEACSYFRKWTEAGLWGQIHNQDWNGATEFSQTRALFWYGLVNTKSGYQGPEYDDEGNETGRMLNDTYKTIPWISETGSNNCFTYYDNQWVYVNKELEAADQSEKLKKVLQIVEFLTSPEATSLVAEAGSDTYVSVNNYEIGEGRIYSAYNDSIRGGFVQPWYYNDFDADSINFVGAAVNAYLAGTGSYDDIFKALDEYNQLELNDQVEVLADFPEGLDREDTARLNALSQAEALNSAFKNNGMEERVEVSIVPYASEFSDLQPFRNVSVSSSFVYEGELDAGIANYIIPAGINSPCAVRLTGAEIKELTEKGFDPSDWFLDAETGLSTFDAEHYGPYPYVVLTEENAQLEDDREYIVALCSRYLSASDYKALEEGGRVIQDLSDVDTVFNGLKAFAAEHPVITSKDLVL